MQRRLFHVLRTVGLLILLGLLYALWGSLTRLWLPCPFHLLTGLDLSAAWSANPGMLVLSPLLLGLLSWHAVTYIRTGNRHFTRGQTFLCWTLVGLFFLHGLLRNLL